MCTSQLPRVSAGSGGSQRVSTIATGTTNLSRTICSTLTDCSTTGSLSQRRRHGDPITKPKTLLFTKVKAAKEQTATTDLAPETGKECLSL